MVFSSPVFLFAFLPIVLAVYFCIRTVGLRNAFLLATSLLFYAWGELNYLWVILVSVTVNYVLAILVERFRSDTRGKLVLALAVVANLLILGSFKYAAFLVGNLNDLLAWLNLQTLTVQESHLPLGISFFTFHALSYVVDVFRGQAKAQRNPLTMSLYICLFPQLVAGPIIRYHDVADQLSQRTVTLDKFAEGVRRFVIGLGKKMLVANALAVPADQIFSLSQNDLTPATAWLGLICYSLQIYFDFSGYSDMAIGLGLMLGFRFLENFNFPYVAQSVREFWRRWHISLSNWFRDYLYIPLGGSHFGNSRTAFNLLTVFLLCGLWHGASWNFVIWGLYYGVFLGLERTAVSSIIESAWRPLRHIYLLLVVMIGWVFFRANDLPHAISYLSALFGQTTVATPVIYPVSVFVDGQVVFWLTIGVIGCTPVLARFMQRFDEPPRAAFLQERSKLVYPRLALRAVLRTAFAALVLSLTVCELATGTYNPFIYFRF